MSLPPVNQVVGAIQGNKFFTLIKGRVQPLSFLEKTWYHINPKADCRRVAKISAVLDHYLQQIPHTADLEEVSNTPVVKATRKFLKNHSKHQQDSKIQKCAQQLLATKLGIHSEPLTCNQSFKQFATDYKLDRYLATYHHNLKVDENHEIQILYQGQHQPWKQVKTLIDTTRPVKDDEKQPWKYGLDGLQDEDMFDWTELKPFNKGNPEDWDNHYLIEFCSSDPGNSLTSGMHSWQRLYTPDGDIYSVGKYRPLKFEGTDFLRSPFRVKKGLLMQPDLSEFWPTKIFSFSYAITKEQFLAIKTKIEKDKKLNLQEFQINHRSCAPYCNESGKIVGLHFPTEIPAWQVITPTWVQKAANAIIKLFPIKTQKFFHLILIGFFNFLMLILGAGKVDKRIKNKETKAHIGSIGDLFDINKVMINHPNHLGQKIRNRVLSWREEEKKKLQQRNLSEEEIRMQSKKIEYDIPPEFKINAKDC